MVGKARLPDMLADRGRIAIPEYPAIVCPEARRAYTNTIFRKHVIIGIIGIRNGRYADRRYRFDTARILVLPQLGRQIVVDRERFTRSEFFDPARVDRTVTIGVEIDPCLSSVHYLVIIEVDKHVLGIERARVTIG